ncbi:deoxyuridine triphosphatase [Ruegeria phage RpAliso]|nr:deoxyuridine triphosphatase [Ruegeria phage RpAliso]
MTPEYSMENVNDAARTFRIERGVPTDILPVKKLNEGATIPTYGSKGAAGMDLYANFHGEDYNAVTIPAGGRMLIKTGIAIACPKGHYARVAPRSGLAAKNGIDVLAGVVDEDYRGEVGVILMNLGFKLDPNGRFVYGDPLIIKHGDRIAQLIIEKFTPCLPVPCIELDSSARGEGGFGSTGK